MAENTIKHTEELTLEEIAKVSSSLGKLRRLLISGGEPFLRDDLSEICQLFYRQNKIKNIHLPTNGFESEKIDAYTYKILNQCPDAKVIVSLPLDGLEETHDKIKGIAGSFKKVIKTVEGLSALKKKFNNLNLYIITVVNKTNATEVVELAKFVKDNLSVDGHGPSPMRGKPYDKDLSAPSYQQWDNLSKQLIEFQYYWNKKRTRNKAISFITTNKIKYLYKVYGQVLRDKRMPFQCQAGSRIAVLEPNGDLRLCELTEVIGNVRSSNYDLKKTLTSEKAKEEKKKVRHCACTHACFLEPSIKMNPWAAFRAYLLGC